MRLQRRAERRLKSNCPFDALSPTVEGGRPVSSCPFRPPPDRSRHLSSVWNEGSSGRVEGRAPVAASAGRGLDYDVTLARRRAGWGHTRSPIRRREWSWRHCGHCRRGHLAVGIKARGSRRQIRRWTAPDQLRAGLRPLGDPCKSCHHLGRVLRGRDLV